MNEKANISKDLNARHRKILEGLLKLPENKECAECKTKGPRWASVNLGIFICMQCSGIHRSLGVHISKVRSATLDTWLPEQVAFIQSMGNEKANKFWEAELPSKYDRVGIENFIRAKYEEKRWIPRDGQPCFSPDFENNLHVSPVATEKSGNVYAKDISTSSKNVSTTTKICIPAPPRGPLPVSPPLPDPAPVTHYVGPPGEATDEADAPDKDSSAKIVHTTDFLNILCTDYQRENSDPDSVEDNSWAGFQSAPAEEASETDISSQTKLGDDLSIPCEVDLLKSPAATAESSKKSPKDVNKDILNLFDKSKMASPFQMHQQKLAMLSQHQSLMIAAAANSLLGEPNVSCNGNNLSHQIWPSAANQVPGLLISVGNPGELQGLIQQGNATQNLLGNNTFPSAVLSSMEKDCQTPVNGTSIKAAAKPQATTSSSLTSGKDYDFSSLTHGMFLKH